MVVEAMIGRMAGKPTSERKPPTSYFHDGRSLPRIWSLDTGSANDNPPRRIGIRAVTAERPRSRKLTDGSCL